MTSRISSQLLEQLTPALDILARLVATHETVSRAELDAILIGLGLETEPSALEELQRWCQLLERLRDNPTDERRRVTVEALQLRGLPQASVLLAISTVVDNQDANPISSTNSLKASVEQLDLGLLPLGQSVSVDFEVEGGPGLIIVHNDQVRVTPQEFGAQRTKVYVEVDSLTEEGTLWTPIQLITQSATLEVRLLAEWRASGRIDSELTHVSRGTTTPAEMIISKPQAGQWKYAVVALFLSMVTMWLVILIAGVFVPIPWDNVARVLDRGNNGKQPPVRLQPREEPSQEPLWSSHTAGATSTIPTPPSSTVNPLIATSATQGSIQTAMHVPTATTTPLSLDEQVAFRNHDNWVNQIAWSPDGQVLALAGSQGVWLYWPSESWRQPSLLKSASTLESVAWSSDGHWLAAGGDDGTVQVWEVTSRTRKSVLEGHRDIVWSVAWSPDSKQLASGSYDGTVHVWDIVEGAKGTPAFSASLATGISSASWSPDGTWLATGTFAGMVSVWDMKTGAQIAIFARPKGIGSVAWSPDGIRLAVGNFDGTLAIYEMREGGIRHIVNLSAHEKEITSMMWSSDGHWLASSGGDGVRVWRLWGVPKLNYWQPQLGYVRSVAWSPNGEQLASVSDDGVIRVLYFPFRILGMPVATFKVTQTFVSTSTLTVMPSPTHTSTPTPTSTSSPTATSSLTYTPTPTQTPTVTPSFTPLPIGIIVAGGNVNVRRGPSTSQPIVTIVRPGDHVNLLEQQGDWYRVRLTNDIEGWIWQPLLGTPTPTQVSSIMTGEDVLP